MILVDTGPLVALFDPRDGQHERCKAVLQETREPLVTTIPVLAETFHMLGPGSLGSARLRDFIARGGISVWFLSSESLQRSFELMTRYADHPMDLADASVIAAAEVLQTLKVFTIDRRDFFSYRIRRGARLEGVDVIG